MVRNVLAGVRHGVWGSGIAGGLLLMLVYLALPERFQSTTPLYLGMAMLLGSSAGMLCSPSEARLQWRGLSPALALVVGAAPLMLAAFWADRADRHVRSAARVQPVRAAPTAAAPSVPHPVAQEQPGDLQALEPLLEELSKTINEKGRPSMVHLDTVARVPAAMVLSGPGARVQLQAAAQQLSEVQSSLADIKARNRDLRPLLDRITGDAGSLNALVSELRDIDQLLETLHDQPPDQAAGALGPALSKLRELQAGTMQWIVECNQRLEEARAARMPGKLAEAASG